DDLVQLAVGDVAGPAAAEPEAARDPAQAGPPQVEAGDCEQYQRDAEEADQRVAEGLALQRRDAEARHRGGHERHVAGVARAGQAEGMQVLDEALEAAVVVAGPGDLPRARVDAVGEVEALVGHHEDAAVGDDVAGGEVGVRVPDHLERLLCGDRVRRLGRLVHVGVACPEALRAVEQRDAGGHQHDQEGGDPQR
ncbi:hypothetical protein BFX14_17635, partial [Vibrio cholerae]